MIQFGKSALFRRFCGAARAIPEREIIAVISTLAIGHPFSVRLPTLIMGAGIVVVAVPADVEIGVARRTGVTEPHALARCKLD
jgi:hypothetical protein